ncbi:MAG TPA: glycosyltransferase family 4 protein [Mycobacteriales bacterium]|nr:glycosyltransferase family 4 protein [Mycobacteriales bacterium]
MRILTISNTYPPHHYGGYELTCADVMQRFVDAGHDVLVLTSTVRVAGAGDDAQAVEVRRALSVAWDWDVNMPRRPRSPVTAWRHARHDLGVVTSAIREHRPDVVSVWHFGALTLPLLVAAEDAGLPMVVTVANDWLLHAEELDAWSRRWRFWGNRLRPTVAGVPTRLPQLTEAHFNFVSAYTRDRAAASTPFRVGDAPIVHPGIDTDDFPITGSAAVPDQWDWRLLYVGRVTPDKGVATAVLALQALPDRATLDIVGDGEPAYVESLRRLAVDLHMTDRVRFDRCSRSELAARYEAADAVIFPSEWPEPFGLVPIEAMACGVPVVATGTGGSGEFLVDGDNCLRFPAGNAQALAARLQRLAGDSELRSRLLAGGRRTAAELTADAYADTLLELHVTASRSRPARVGSPRRKEDRR